KKRQLRRCLIDEEETFDEVIDCTTAQSIQKVNLNFMLLLTAINQLRKRRKPQKSIGSRVISFRGVKSSVSEPTNLPITPIDFIWKGKDAITTNQLQTQMIQKLRPGRG
ncbi:hypothetical protein H5410_056666, partial [Solanum commersonii]